MQILLLIAASLAGDASSQFQRVVDENPPLDPSISCSYLASSQFEGRAIQENHTQKYGWRLLSVDGKPPSASDLKDYRKRARERERRVHPTKFDLSVLAREGSIEIISENFETLTFSFSVNPMDRGNNMALVGRLHGILVVNKESLKPLRLVIENKEPISPIATMKIEKFRQEMTFSMNHKLPGPLVEEMRFVFRGRFLIKRFNNERSVRYSNYECNPDYFPAF